MSESQVYPETRALSPIKTVLMGTMVTLGNVALGYNPNAISIALDGIANSLKVTDRDIQWTFNSLLLVFVSRRTGPSIETYPFRCHDG